MIAVAAPQYPSERRRDCERCAHYLGGAAVCPVCGWEDDDKLEDRAIAHAEEAGYARPNVDEGDDKIVIFTEREFRGLQYIKHARQQGWWAPVQGS